MNWPEGISDGLCRPCILCNKTVSFDYTIEDEVWNKIVPFPMAPDVICLPCLDKLGYEKGIRVGLHLERVQFTGTGHTVELKPSLMHSYSVTPSTGDIDETYLAKYKGNNKYSPGHWDIEINYKKLLKKYINSVDCYEGTTFINRIIQDFYKGDRDYSEREIEELERLNKRD